MLPFLLTNPTKQVANGQPHTTSHISTHSLEDSRCFFNLSTMNHERQIAKRETPNRGSSIKESPSIQTFEVTAYAPTGRRTATGPWPQTHKTIAADWTVLKPGTIVEIENLKGTYIVQDSGGAVKGNIIDLFVASEGEAIKWGRQNLKVKILWSP